MATTTPQAQLLHWYSTRYPFRINIVGDYAGSSPFFIDGDSLLREIFSDQRIDFSTGFQLLHATYVAEQFLENLRRRNCVFDVVFFEQHRNICMPAWNPDGSWKYSFAREVIIRHFESLSRDGKRFAWKFDTVVDKAFENWLFHRQPLFIMAHDGEDILAQQGDDDPEESEDEYEDEDSITVKEWEVKAMIYRFMHIGKGYNVALINSVEFEDSKIFARVLETGLKRADVESGVDTIPTDFMTDLSAPVRMKPLPSMNISIPSTVSNFRERLTVYTLIRLFRGVNTWPEKVVSLGSAYLLHTAFLNHLSLEERHFAASANTLKQAKQEANVDGFLKWFIKEATRVTEEGLVKFDDTVQLCDCVDGRLFLKLLVQKVEIPEPVAQDFERLSAAVKDGVGGSFGLAVSTSALGSIPADSVPEEPVISVSVAILPFSNPQINQHLDAITIDVDILPKHNEFDTQVTRDQYHVHKVKKPHKAIEKPQALVGRRTVERKPMLNKGRGTLEEQLAKRAQGRIRRREQMYLSRVQRYAASLTDAVDGSLHQKLIVCDEGGNKSKKQTQEKVKAEKGKPGKGGTGIAKAEDIPVLTVGGKPGKQVKGGKKEQAGKKAPVLSKADKIKLQNAEKATLKEAKTFQTSWKNLCNELSVTKDEEAIISRLDDHIKKLSQDVPKTAAVDNEGRFIEVEVWLYKIMTLQKLWITLCKAGEKANGYNTVAVMFDEARKALQCPALTTTVKSSIQNVFVGLGIALPPSKPTIGKRPISFTTSWTGKVEGDDTKLDMSSEEFQLSYFGPYMDRNMDSAPDERVTFEPDGWQRDVLDEIDADSSVFVVALTSAGKTFISFHAMEKVLKADDSGILVYIAPTKPLVNQIAAEVLSRFRKNYRHAGKTIWAIHNGDFQTYNPTECQILITIPSILCTMLMSPANAKNWAPRVKRIIFDEVHSVGNAEDGVVWEQLLLLAPCPIIALSATVGNPHEFSEWLKTTQSSLNIKLRMIQYPHRYSDLRKFIYRPPKSLGTGNYRFAGLGQMMQYGQIDGTPGFDVIHPVAALVDSTHGMPDDLALEPGDSLRLYLAMKTVSTSQYPVPDELDYRKVFGTTGNVIKKVDTTRWEASLKSVLKKWMVDAGSPFSKVVELLQNKASTESTVDITVAAEAVKQEKILDETMFASEAYEHGDVVTLAHLRQKTLPLLASLHAANALPALMFSYNRSLCEYICLQVTTQLQEAEDHFRKTDPRWKAKIKDWELHLERKRKMGSKMRKVILEDGETKFDAVRDLADVEFSALDSFDPEDPWPQFSFGDFKRYRKTEWESDLRQLERWGVPRQLCDAFRRGIGVHHSGLKRPYRQLVETLFRKGYLRLIISTGDLAMGINMPCKTVIFAGDNINLTALNYRQASGRAGRRGFDLLGNVIFHGLPIDSAYRLIGSRLPRLMGHFPMSTSLVLRLFILLHHSKDSEYAKTTISMLLKQPRLVMGGDSCMEQVLHHLRFSIEYLRRQKLLGPGGNPLNFAGLTGHLSYTEKSAFAFHALLCSGTLAGLVRGFATGNQLQREAKCETLMLIMCNLFGRLPASRGRKNVRVLPPLPQEVSDLFAKINQDTLKTYSTYVETFAKQYCNTTNYHILPFSRLSAGSPGLGTPGSPNHARSSFVALSGHTDLFKSIADMSSSLRGDIFFEGSAIPCLPVDDIRLNSYLLDFYKHGNASLLAKENSVMAGDVWFVLKDFSVVLATIVAGLLSYIKDGPGAYFNAASIKIRDEDGEMLAEDGEAEEEEEEEEDEEEKGVHVEYYSDGEEFEVHAPPRVGRENQWQMKKESRRRIREVENLLEVVREVQGRFEKKFKTMWA
ncbi:P-loop containing nucleoside triphosphate hydrolase protein [Wilcoxina mikolae CBS 423.85]|nr:P-loop containing nucleoside triphosphate hydrolase protein [Wilcoxina mikolae CBS 423.85]